MKSEKISCKVIIKNGNSRFLPIAGDIDKIQLSDKSSEWLLVENVVFQNHNYEFNRMIVYKADIDRIIILKPVRELTFEKSDFGLSATIQFL